MVKNLGLGIVAASKIFLANSAMVSKLTLMTTFAKYILKAKKSALNMEQRRIALRIES